MYYQNKFKLVAERLNEEYRDDLRIFNTKVIMYLIKSKLYKSILNNKDLVISNTKGDTLSMNYDNNSNILNIKLYINGQAPIDITNLIMSSNKYGSSVIKRFFKHYYTNVYNTLMEEKSKLAELYYVELTNMKGNTYLTNMYGERLRKHNSKYSLESKDASNTTVIHKMSKVEVIEFLTICSEINYIKGW